MPNSCMLSNCSTGYKDLVNEGFKGARLSRFRFQKIASLGNDGSKQHEKIMKSQIIQLFVSSKEGDLISNKEIDYGSHKDCVLLKKKRLEDGVILCIWPSNFIYTG